MAAIKITSRPFIIDPVAEFTDDREPAELLLDPRIQDTVACGGEIDIDDGLLSDGRFIASIRAEVEEDLWRYVMESA